MKSVQIKRCPVCTSKNVTVDQIMCNDHWELADESHKKTIKALKKQKGSAEYKAAELVVIEHVKEKMAHARAQELEDAKLMAEYGMGY